MRTVYSDRLAWLTWTKASGEGVGMIVLVSITPHGMVSLQEERDFLIRVGHRNEGKGAQTPISIAQGR